MRYIFVFLFLLLLSPFYCQNCEAKQFEVDGFTVNLFWEVRGKKILVSGSVEDGQACKQVNVEIYFHNRDMDGIAHIATSTTRSHEPGRKTRFEGKDTINSNKNRDEWYINNIFLNCL